MEPINITPPVGFTSLDQAINTLIPAVFMLAGFLAFAYLMYASLRYLTAGSDETKTQAARTIFKNVFVGLLLLSFVFVAFRFLVALIPGMDQFFAP